MRHQNVAAAIVAGLVIGSVLAPTLADAQGERALTPSGEGWEYAELRLFGTDAVLQTRDEAIFLEGPEGRKARQPIDVGKEGISVRRAIPIHHLTAAGARGWELIGIPTSQPGVYMLKRRVELARR